MSIGLVLNHTYKQTCEICDWISKMAQIAFVAVIAFSESAGRARAASHLSNMGYYEEAKALMLKEDKDDQSANHLTPIRRNTPIFRNKSSAGTKIISKK